MFTKTPKKTYHYDLKGVAITRQAWKLLRDRAERDQQSIRTICEEAIKYYLTHKD
jgi:hypothetical protein